MPRFIGHYVGISFQAELLAMTILGLLNSTLEWYPFDWSHQVKKVWELTLSQHYFLFYTDFEYWIKTILTWIVITRKIVAYIYTFSYMLNLYPILTWSRPNLLLPWLILSFAQNFMLKSIVIMIFLWLWGGERFSFLRTIEFFLVEFISLITSAYIWYAIACSCIQLKRMEKIRHIRKALQEKYSIGYDLFLSDGSSMEISKESSYGSSLGGRRHMSLPNLNEAFYRSIFTIENYSDNKLTRSLTILSTINSFSDSEGFISQIVHNADLTPAEKCMKLLGITDVDVINARARVHKRLLEACTRSKDNYARMFPLEERKRPKKDETEEIRDPSVIDYLMTKTELPGKVFRKDDACTDTTLKEVDREKDCPTKSRQETEKVECFILGTPTEITLERVEREEDYTTESLQQMEKIESFVLDRETADKKTEGSSIQSERCSIVLKSEMEKECELDSDRVKEETKSKCFKKRKKKKVHTCPLMKELIEARPCFPLVGRREFKECPFKKDIVSSCPPFPCFPLSDKKNKQLCKSNVTKTTETVACQVESKDVPKSDCPTSIVDREANDETKFGNNLFLQNKSNTNVLMMREPTNKGSQKYLTSIETSNVETLNLSNLPKELRLEPRRNFNHIFNNPSNVLPLANVWSTIGCLPFRQKFNFTNLYGGTELHFDKSFFKPSSSQKLLDRGRSMAWKASSAEQLVKIPEQIICNTVVGFKPTPTPETSKETRFFEDKLRKLSSVDQESIKTHRCASIEYPELKEKPKDDNPLYVSESVSMKTRNSTQDCGTLDRKTISTQTIETIGNYNYEMVVRLAKKTSSYVTYDTDDMLPSKFVSKVCETRSLVRTSQSKTDVHKNDTCSNASSENSIGNEYCCCKNSYSRIVPENLNAFSLDRTMDSSECEKSNYSNKPPAYPMKTKKRSLHRLAGRGAANKIAKISFENNEHQSKNYEESSKKKKRVTSSTEREKLEMRALRAYNEITLLEDKREMGEKMRRTAEATYSFVNDGFTDSRVSEEKSELRVREINDNEESSNEIEIVNSADSLIKYVTSFNSGKISENRYSFDLPKRESSCSKLPDIQNKDTAIMLNLLDRHGSHWFKQEVGKILDIRNNQVNVKQSEPSSYALKLDSFVTDRRDIDDIRDGRELERSRGKENISVSFRLPLGSDLDDTNRNVSNDKRDDLMILNTMESIVSEAPIQSNTFPTLAAARDRRIRHQDDPVNEPIDVDGFDRREEVRRRNMSLHMMNIAKNIGWSLRPNGIVLTNKNLPSQSPEATNRRSSQRRDIIDDITSRRVHAAFSNKPGILVRTFSTRTTTDGPTNLDSSNTCRMTSTIDEFVLLVLRANNEINASTLPDIQEPQINNQIDNPDNDEVLPSSSDSMETERDLNLRDNVEVIDSRCSETRKTNVSEPRIDPTGEEDTTKNTQERSLELIIAFFSFLLTYYAQYLGSCLFTLSDSSSSLYAYRPCEVHSGNAFKENFSERSLPGQNDALALSTSEYNANVSELVVRSENEEGVGVIDFISEVDENEDEVSTKNMDQEVSSLRDSFDTIYSRSTVESENALSLEEASSMEEFS